MGGRFTLLHPCGIVGTNTGFSKTRKSQVYHTTQWMLSEHDCIITENDHRIVVNELNVKKINYDRFAVGSIHAIIYSIRFKMACLKWFKTNAMTEQS